LQLICGTALLATALQQLESLRERYSDVY